MFDFLQSIILFYQTRTTFKIFGASFMLAIPLAVAMFSLYEKNKLARNHFAIHAMHKYRLSQASLVVVFLFFGGISEIITHPMCYKDSGIIAPLVIGAINVCLSLIALGCLLLLEARAAMIIYTATNLTIPALLDSRIKDYETVNMLSIGAWIFINLAIGLLSFKLGDISAQEHLKIKTTDDLEKTLS